MLLSALLLHRLFTPLPAHWEANFQADGEATGEINPVAERRTAL